MRLAGFGRLIAAGVVGTIAAFWTWTASGETWRSTPRDPGVETHLLDNGFHTDMAVPRARLEALGGPLAEATRTLGPGDWVLIGWGDAKFYVDQSPIGDRLADGARAFFRPGNVSVVMLDPSDEDPAALADADRRRTLTLSHAQFRRAMDRVEESLDLQAGHARVAAARPGDDARFFASREHFWIGHLCNHWTASVLNAAGVPVRPLRSVTSAEVMDAIDRAQLDRAGTRD